MACTRTPTICGGQWGLTNPRITKGFIPQKPVACTAGGGIETGQRGGDAPVRWNGNGAGGERRRKGAAEGAGLVRRR
jgi:hypothetical protein